MKSFTLIETIIAMGISTIIIASAAGLYLAGSNAYKRGSIERELVQNGFVAIDRISREIRQASGMATVLPEDESGEPAQEIMFRDGHNQTGIQYIRYYLSGSNLYREVRFYYFSSDYAKTHVTWDSIGVLEEKPVWENPEDGVQMVAENFSSLEFFGSPLIKMRFLLSKSNLTLNLASAVWGRNIN